MSARHHPVIVTPRTNRQFTEVRSVHSDADQTFNSVFDKSLASETDYKVVNTTGADSLLMNSLIEEVKSNFTQNTSMYHVSCRFSFFRTTDSTLETSRKLKIRPTSQMNKITRSKMYRIPRNKSHDLRKDTGSRKRHPVSC